MAIDNPTLVFLLGLRGSGLDFSETLTLGRQQRNIDRPDLLSFLESATRGGEQTSESSPSADLVFRSLGVAKLSSMDKSPYEGASIEHDLNEPINQAWHDKFDAVFDGGTLEHVLNFPCAVRSAMEMVKVGGHFLSVTIANNYMGHGFYQFSPELFYRVLSPENGFRVRCMLLHERKPDGRWFLVKDPKQYGRRVELRNGEYTYMFTVAERMDERQIFSVWPTQSDYVRLHGGEKLIGKPSTPTKSLLGAVKKFIPNSVKHSIKSCLPARPEDPFAEPCFREIGEHEVLSGKFLELFRDWQG